MASSIKTHSFISRILSKLLVRRTAKLYHAMNNNPELVKKTKELENAIVDYTKYVRDNSSDLTVSPEQYDNLKKLLEL